MVRLSMRVGREGGWIFCEIIYICREGGGEAGSKVILCV